MTPTQHLNFCSQNVYFTSFSLSSWYLSLGENMLNERNCISKAVLDKGKHLRNVVKLTSVNFFQAICQISFLFFFFHSVTKKNFNDLYVAINLPSHLSNCKLFQSDLYAFDLFE